jgi:hypothetical protein
MSATGEPVPFEVDEPGVYLHGTKADLAAGDMLVPGRGSNFEEGRVMNHVYFTATLDAAVWGADFAAGQGRGRIYIVEPSGAFEDDPNVTNKRVPRESDAVLPQPRAAARGGRACRLGGPLTGEVAGDAGRTQCVETGGCSQDRRLIYGGSRPPVDRSPLEPPDVAAQRRFGTRFSPATVNPPPIGPTMSRRCAARNRFASSVLWCSARCGLSLSHRAV